MRNENMSNTATISQGQEILALQDELTGALIVLARSCGNNPKTENTDEKYYIKRTGRSENYRIYRFFEEIYAIKRMNLLITENGMR